MNLNTEKVIYAVAGAVIGGATTYFATKKAISRKFAAIADEEIESVKDSYNLFHGKGKYEDPEVQVAAVAQRMGYFEQLNDLAYAAMDDQKAEDLEKRAVEAEAKAEAATDKIESNYLEADEWVTKDVGIYDPDEPSNQEDYTEYAENVPLEEAVMRSADVPYYISEPEFMEDEETFSKIHVEWYEEDETLSDDNDQIIPPAQTLNLLGPEFQDFFGKDPENPHIVHMRNERTRSDFEIALNPGSYTKLVLGYETSEEDRDRHRKQLKKMRNRE